MTRRPLLYSLILLMVLLWAGNFIIVKIALREFPPLLLSALRVVLAGVFILPIYWWRNRRKPDHWTREDLPLLIHLGLFGVALNQIFFVLGLSRTTVAHSSFILSLTPILVLFIAGLMKMEEVTARKLAGMAVAASGVAVLKAFEGIPAKGARPTWLGDALIFLGGLTFALFTVFGKRASKRHNAITVTTFGYVGGAFALSPLIFWQGARFPFEGVTPAGWAALVYMALFPSVVCYLIYYYALSHIAASRVSAFSYLQPPLATALGFLLLGERVTLPVVLGGAVIFSGVYLAERG